MFHKFFLKVKLREKGLREGRLSWEDWQQMFRSLGSFGQHFILMNMTFLLKFRNIITTYCVSIMLSIFHLALVLRGFEKWWNNFRRDLTLGNFKSSSGSKIWDPKASATKCYHKGISKPLLKQEESNEYIFSFVQFHKAAGKKLFH